MQAKTLLGSFTSPTNTPTRGQALLGSADADGHARTGVVLLCVVRGQAVFGLELDLDPEMHAIKEW
jgi:hypothetical protein